MRFSSEHKAKIGLAVTGSNNGNWRGDNIGIDALHEWLRRHWPEPKPISCQNCNQVKRLDLCNIRTKYDPETYTRDFKNWQWLCRKCHHESDGRISQGYKNKGCVPWSKGMKGLFAGETNPFYGKKHSDITRAKMRAAWEIRRQRLLQNNL